jgi:hypothetical protein
LWLSLIARICAAFKTKGLIVDWDKDRRIRPLKDYVAALTVSAASPPLFRYDAAIYRVFTICGLFGLPLAAHHLNKNIDEYTLPRSILTRLLASLTRQANRLEQDIR